MGRNMVPHRLQLPDGGHSESSCGECRLWRLSDGAELAVLRGHAGRGVWRVAVHGDRLATAGADASVKLWSLRDALWQSSGEAESDRGAAAQDPDGDGLQTLAYCPSPSASGGVSGGALSTPSGDTSTQSDPLQAAPVSRCC